MTPVSTHLISTLALLGAMAAPALAQPTVYPASARVIDLTAPPYNVDPTGVADAAPAINQAFLDHNDEHEILYLPAGTYRLAGPVEWGFPEGCNLGATYTCQRNTVLAGAGRDATTLRLDDGHPAFQDPGNPVPLVSTGASAAMSFENSVRHLTISTGRDNPGADGLAFNANNNGGLYEVEIRSEDGAGVRGLNLRIGVAAGPQNGPCIGRGVVIDGFARGIATLGQQNGMVFEDLTLRNQTEYGVFNQQHVLTIRRLLSENAVPALFNQGDGNSTLTVIEAELRGSGAADGTAAVINNNRRSLFLRDVVTSGYANALVERQNGFLLESLPDGAVGEYFAGEVVRACDNVARSLDLPVVETPAIAYADTATWVSVADFGAEVDNGFQGEGSPQDDTEAFRAALNSGASTIVIPSPGEQFPDRYIVYGDLVIPPTVTHIIGAKATIGGSWRFVTDAGADRLVIEDFTLVPGIAHRSARELHLARASVTNYESLPGGGSGDVFIEDVNGGPYYFNRQTVYARQFNPESSRNDSVNVVNDGGLLWVLGLKTEKRGTIISTLGGGRTEVFGSFAYKTQPDTLRPDGGDAVALPPQPMYEVVDASLSVNGFSEITYIGDPWDVKLRETRGEVTREVRAPDVQLRTSLLAAFVPDGGAGAPPTADAGDDQVLVPPALSTALAGSANDDGLPGGDCFAERAWTLVDGPADPTFADAADPTTAVTFPEAGRYTLALSAADGAAVTRDTVVVYAFDAYSSTLDHDQDGTPSGRGADADLRASANRDNNYGGAATAVPRNFVEFAGKSLIRVDRAAFPSAVEGALLEFEIATANSGLIEAWTYNVFGLDDGNPAEGWVEGDGDGGTAAGSEVTYVNAPANAGAVPGGAYDPDVEDSGGARSAETTFLGTFTLRPGRREKVALAGEALAAFTNADTDGQLTFLLTRVESVSNAISFATKENETFAAPRLYYDFTDGDPLAAVEIDLLDLSARVVGDSIVVEWAVASETGVEAYTVERSLGGGPLELLGEVPAVGGVNLGARYEFADDFLAPGRRLYRVTPRGVGGRGAANAAAVATLEVGGADGRWLLAPNPALGAAEVRVLLRDPGDVPREVVIDVRDSSGRLLARHTPSQQLGGYTVPLDGYAAGVYLVAVRADGQVDYHTLVR